MRIRKLDSHIKKYHPVSNYANQKFYQFKGMQHLIHVEYFLQGRR